MEMEMRRRKWRMGDEGREATETIGIYLVVSAQHHHHLVFSPWHPRQHK